jgi:hypothetical protein
MPSNDQQVQSYLRYYSQQRGGQLPPVFRGARQWQKGDGFGDVLRGIFRWFLPVLTSGASSFINEAAAGQARGQSLGEAAKGALRPAIGSLIGAAAKRMQGGTGRRRSKKRKSVKRKSVKRSKRVYKGSQKGGKSAKSRQSPFPFPFAGKAPKRKSRKSKKVKKSRKSKKTSRKRARKSTPEYNF